MNTLQSYWESIEARLRSCGASDDVVFIARAMFFNGAGTVFLIDLNMKGLSRDAKQAVWQGVVGEVVAADSRIKATDFGGVGCGGN